MVIIGWSGLECFSNFPLGYLELLELIQRLDKHARILHFEGESLIRLGTKVNLSFVFCLYKFHLIRKKSWASTVSTQCRRFIYEVGVKRGPLNSYWVPSYGLLSGLRYLKFYLKKITATHRITVRMVLYGNSVIVTELSYGYRLYGNSPFLMFRGRSSIFLYP